MKKHIIVLMALFFLTNPQISAAFSLGGNDTSAGFSKLVEKVAPSVVNVYTTKELGIRPNQFQGVDPFFQQFLQEFYNRQNPQPRQQREQNSLGSGFIISADGQVLTNYHVIAGADEVFVNLHSGAKVKAQVLGYDEKLDLALLKINANETLTPLPLANSDSAKIGDWVVAVGNPFGLGQTVTAGIVSAKGRVLGAGPYDDFIQTDASINPGNSGGPLFNLDGEVVGINSAIIASGQGIGFAIPINMAKQVMPQLSTSGHVRRGWMGLSIKDVPQGNSAAPVKGVLVLDTLPNGPAAQAGIRSGDVITTIDGKDIENAQAMPRLVATYLPGTKVEVTYMRGGTTFKTTAVLGDLDNPNKAFVYSTNSDTKAAIGLDVRDLEKSDNADTTSGVYVTKIHDGSIAGVVGLLRGDIIVSLNGTSIPNVQTFKNVLSKTPEGSTISLHVLRGKTAMYFAFQKE